MFTRRPARLLERRLRRVGFELAAAREAVRVAEEQLGSFVDDADEARVRSLVTSNSADRRDHREAEGHRQVAVRALESARRRVAELEARQAELLRQYPI